MTTVHYVRGPATNRRRLHAGVHCPAWVGVPKTHWGEIFSKEAFLFIYAHAIITCHWFETALNYIEEFPCLVHTLSVTLTALQYKQQ